MPTWCPGGDVAPGVRGVQWAARSFEGTPVVYVLGNHEFYGNAIPGLLDKLRGKRVEGVHVLENEALEIRGVTFLGCTLWTDFGLFGNPELARRIAGMEMADYARYRIGSTQVVCNPRGYPDEPSSGFEPGLVIEV